MGSGYQQWTHRVFVGRERELGELQRAFTETRSGHGRMFLIVGEPGIGKTRLSEECAVFAATQGAQILRGRCWQGGGVPAYWPWVQIIRACVRERAPQALRDLIGSTAPHFLQITPELRDKLPELSLPPPSSSPDARFYLFDSTTMLLRNMARQQPTVLIVDDLHDADGPSLLLLQFLARELRDTGLLVLGTFRCVEARRQPAIAQLLGDLAREATTLPLIGLNGAEVAQMILDTTGIEPAEALVATIHRATQGNPFFVAEVARLLLAEGRLQLSGPVISRSLGIPVGVREAIHRRLEPLPTEARRVLSIAAVIGGEFDLVPLQKAAGVPTDALLEMLGEAMALDILSDLPETIGRYRFAHGLVRETLYDELDPTTRIRLHERIGGVLEQLHAQDSEAHLEALAHHFLEAAAGGEAQRAVDYAARAGQRALALLAYEEAVTHFEHALQALDMLPAPNQAQRCELLVALCEAQSKSGSVEDAVVTCRRAADLARHVGAAERFTQAVLDIGAGWIQDRAFGTLVVGLLEEALDMLPKTDSALRARVLTKLAWQSQFQGSRERRAMFSTAAVEMARRVGDHAALAYALAENRGAQWGVQTVGDRLAAADEIARLNEHVGSHELTLHSRSWRIFALMELGDVVQADREIASLAALAEQVRHPAFRWLGVVLWAMRAMMEGRLEEAESLALQAFDIGQPWRLGSVTEVFGAQLFTLRWMQGRYEEIVPGTAADLELHPDVTVYRAALALLYSELGRRDEARVELELLALNDFSTLPRDDSWPCTVSFLSIVVSILGDRARAATLYDLLLPLDGEHISVVAYMGPVSHYLGLLASVTERWEVAASHFQDAIAMTEKVKAKPFVAFAKQAYANMMMQRGRSADRAAAATMRAQAHDIAAQLGLGGALAKSRCPEQESVRPAHPITATSPLEWRTETRSGAVAAAFHRDHKYWRIEYRGEVSRLRDSLGMRYIACLLAHPGEDLHVLTLLATTNGPGPEQAVAAAQAAGELTATRPGDAGVLLDAQAKTAYRQRLQELRSDLANAQAAGDTQGAQRVEEEIDFITGELTRAVGLGGRDRRAGSTIERSRINVTKAIKAALRSVAAANPSLGHHLAACIRTGAYCSYRMDPAVLVRWEL